MALTKEQKSAIVKDIGELLNSSKLTVVAKYSGIDVKSMQDLRRQARANSTTVRVIKNRLVKKALKSSNKFSAIDTSLLTSQLLYAFNPLDEAAPAQVLNDFAKKVPNLQFVGAFNSDGTFMASGDVKQLADLPSKDVLRAQMVSTIAAPLSGFANVLNGNLRGLINVLNAKAVF